MKILTKHNNQTAQSGMLATKQTAGYTLVELLIVLGIAAIMMAVGAPKLMDTLNRNAQVNAVNVFKAGISSARANALTRKRPVVIQSMTAGGDWSKGFDIKFGTTASDPEMSTEFEQDNKIKIKEMSNKSFLSFDQLGRVTPASSTFQICNQNTGQAVMIDINIFGNAVVRKVGDKFQFVACP